MTKHRTVEVYQFAWDNDLRRHVKEFVSIGVFHEFGLGIDDDANTNLSVAIIELPDGQIVTPQANMIKFTSPIECDVAAITKTVATEFYRYWHNAPGTNTDQGFDDWWKNNRQRILSKDQS